MTKVKTLCASGALLLIGSTLAFAQTIIPPTDGSHPDLATQPDYHATKPSTPVAAAPVSQLEIKAAVRKQIEDAGYYSVYDITPSFDGYHARAMEPGQRVTVDVDGNGNVRLVSKEQ